MHVGSRVTCVPRLRRDEASLGMDIYDCEGAGFWNGTSVRTITGTSKSFFCFNHPIAGRTHTFFCSLFVPPSTRPTHPSTSSPATMHFTSTLLIAAVASLAHAQQATTPKGFTPSVNTKLDVTFNSTAVKTPGELLSKASM
jgi:hypothetical protein